LKLSIIIPVFNEVRCLNRFANNLKNSFKYQNVEYIFVNDGSNDGSKEWLTKYINEQPNKNYKLINMEKNFGKGRALIEGLKIASGDFFLFQDSDLELDTNDSLEMYKIIEGNSEIKCIFGNRYLSGKLKRNNNYLNELVGKLNTFLFNILFQQSISDLHCGTKLISKEVKNKIKLSVNDFGIEIDIATQIAKNNFPIFEYGISYYARSFEEGKKITWVDGLKSYYYLFKTRFINNPLSTQISLVFSACYMSYVGSFFGQGNGKLLVIIVTLILGLLIGLNRKVIASSIIFLSCYLGSLIGNGNEKIFSTLAGILFGIYISGLLKNYINNNNFKLLKLII